MYKFMYKYSLICAYIYIYVYIYIYIYMCYIGITPRPPVLIPANPVRLALCNPPRCSRRGRPARRMVWCDVAWCSMMWRDVTKHDMTWRDQPGNDMTWHDMTWHAMTWHGMAWHGMSWHDMMNNIMLCHSATFDVIPVSREMATHLDVAYVSGVLAPLP